MWSGPVVPMLLQLHTHSPAGGPVRELVTRVCEQLCRACHRVDRGIVMDADRTVDRFSQVGPMMSRLKCQLLYDSEQEALVLVAQDA